MVRQAVCRKKIDTPKNGRSPEVPLSDETIRALLGHSDITMTMRYAHLSADARRDAVQLLDAHNHGNTMATEAAKA